MFHDSNMMFRFGYFISSIFPLNLLLFLFGICIYIYNTNIHGWLPLIVFLLLTLLGIISGIYINHILNTIPKAYESMNVCKVRIVNKCSNNMINLIYIIWAIMFLILGLITHQFNYLTISTMVLELILYTLYKKSSIAFPNMLLMILGYSIIDSMYNNKKGHVFVKRNNFNKIDGKTKNVIQLDNNVFLLYKNL